MPAPSAPSPNPAATTLGPDVHDRIDGLRKQARKALPDIKRRFHAGLPQGDSLYVMTNARDPEGQAETIYVQVEQWEGTRLSGTVKTNVLAVKTVHLNDKVTIPEAAVMDWTILHPDGTVEGNAIGNFVEAQRRRQAEERAKR